MLIKQGEKMINKNTVIRVITHDSNHEFIGTKSEAKKYYLKFALENRNKELTYSEDIRRFTLDELIWFVFGGNVESKKWEISYYKVSNKFQKGTWEEYNMDYENLFERKENPFLYKTQFIYDDLMW